MHTISNIEIKNKRVLVRVDFNVPLDAQGAITDDTRMRAAIPTIQHIIETGGAVILMSHLGRPKEGPSAKYSLQQLVSHLQTLLPGVPVKFANDCIGEDAIKKSAALLPGEVLLLENLRFYKERKRLDC